MTGLFRIAATGIPGRSVRLVRALGAAGLLAVFATAASAAEFRSVAEAGAILYDAPASGAKRMYVATRGLPVEVITSEGNWVRVRDPSGDLAWIERKSLSDRRTVVVTVPVAEIRTRAEPDSPVVFQAAQGVSLEVVDAPAEAPGWLRVRHRDGASGFARLRDVWGA